MKHRTYDRVGNITISAGKRTGSLSPRYGYGYDYDMTYAYDLNGNLAHESVARKRLNGDTTHNISERKLLWDGMNRLKAISENGYVSLYWYDPDGNRTVKEHGGGEAVWVNSKHAGTMTDTVTCSIYPNPYININGNRWTKHYYIGGERIASMTGTISGGFEGLNATGNYAAGHDSGMTIRYDLMRSAEGDSIDSMYARLGVPYRAHQTNTRGDGWYLYLPAKQADENVADGSDRGQGGSHPLTLGDGQVYYYHRDHLGSTMSVTDSIGNTVQQVEYTPWGEVFVERRFGTSGYDTPYLFNGKELDEETGLYYYGARYYDPKMSVWYSTDPMEMDYPGTSSYGYCLGNSVKFIDIYGMAPGDRFKNPTLAAIDFGITYNVESIQTNKELASFIYKMKDKNGKTYYTYPGPAKGSKDHVSKEDMKSIDRSKISVDEFIDVVANIHTHGRGLGNYENNIFSGEQATPEQNKKWKGEKRRGNVYKRDDISEANRTQTYSYVVTPNGELRGYDPKTGKVTVWSTKMPTSDKETNNAGKTDSNNSLWERFIRFVKSL